MFDNILQEEDNKYMSKQSGFAHLLLIGVIILGAIVGVYYLGTKNTIKLENASATPTSERESAPLVNDETANWKTYTNNKYKFSIKYPSSLTVRPDSSDEFAGFLEDPKQNSTQVLWVSVEKNGDNLSLEDFYKKLEQETVPSELPNPTTETKVINGYQFLVTHSCSNCKQDDIGSESYIYRVKVNNVIVAFSGEYMSQVNGITLVKNPSEQKDFLYKISSTFKFTN